MMNECLELNFLFFAIGQKIRERGTPTPPRFRLPSRVPVNHLTVFPQQMYQHHLDF